MSGKEFSEDEVFNEVAKDKVFYENSGGGVTISGGEPLLQIDFTHGILKKLKENGINTAVETAGNISFENFERIISLVDSWLYDIKFFDRKKHERWTGSSNELALSNLERLTSKTEAEIIVRVPLIPCVNDGEEFEKIINHIIKFPKIKELHILPFHQIGSSKFADLGIEYEMENHREENDGNIERAKKYAEEKGLKVSVGGAGF
jgi:pyruvate formate lyase activating enzyme